LIDVTLYTSNHTVLLEQNVLKYNFAYKWNVNANVIRVKL